MNLSARLRQVKVLVLLVAVLAVLAVALRNSHEVPAGITRAWGPLLETFWARPTINAVVVIIRLESDLMAALVVVTIGLGLAAIRKPMLPGRGRWPGRGMAAIVVGAFAVLQGVVGKVVSTVTKPVTPTSGRFDAHFFSDLLRNCQNMPPQAILGAWALLALAGRWRSTEGGFGRVGRWVGWCWLASILFDLWRSTLW